MNLVRPSPELTARIQGWIDELQAESLGAWPIRVCKEELNALPIHSTIIFLWALRPDGTVLCMDHEASFHPTEPETDPLSIYAALAQGTLKHPELAELLPPAEEAVCPCSSCGGTGRQEQRLSNSTHETFCYGCNGLGWVIDRSLSLSEDETE